MPMTFQITTLLLLPAERRSSLKSIRPLKEQSQFPAKNLRSEEGRVGKGRRAGEGGGSRRRHTRWPRDWSSDVCSSDLYLAWPRWADHYRKSSVELRFLKPLHADDFPDYDTFAATCREKIQFEEYPAPEGAEPISCKKPASGVERFLYRCPDTGINRALHTPDGVNIYSRHSPLHYRMD